MQKMISLMLAFCLLLALCACGSTQGPPPEQLLITQPETSSNAAPAPVQTPEPEPEPEPTPEPEITMPDPVVYTGTGDDVIQIEPTSKGYVFYIEGNADSHHFAVTAYDNAGEYVDLLVNTTDPYSGTVADTKLATTMLEIKATGDWLVEEIPILALPVFTSGQTVVGDNDEVFLSDGSVKIAHIAGNAESHHFAIWAHGSNSSDLLVNTTDPYAGTVMCKCKPTFFEITAVGDWSIELE